MSALLAAALLAQFRARRYIPALYWLVVVLTSIVGTLITDNLVDNVGVSLTATAGAFAVALAVTFLVWYRMERTLSLHTIDSPRREAFYWLAILLTFTLGAATGHLAAQALGLGYLVAAAGFAVLIGIIGLARYLGLGAVLAFWLAYLLTRPLGASLGDLLSQPADAGGLGLGTVLTSLIFLATILGVVIYLSCSHADEPSLGVNDWRGATVRNRTW
jgi:uncharacterized membrane-anchored protein